MNPHYRLRAALLLAAACTLGCGPSHGEEVEAQQPVPVRVAEVRMETLGSTLHAAGTLAPKDQVRLSFKMPGVVASIDVREGDAVSRGQVLASLEQAEVDAAIRQAEAGAAKAARDLERAKALYADGVATKEQLQDLTTAWEVANAAKDSAAFNARFTRIEAPSDGVVTRRLAEPRELVAAGQPLLVVGDTGNGWVANVSLTDRQVVRVQQGDEATVTVDAYADQPLAGRVTKVAAAADAATGTFALEVTVDAAGLRLAQGLVAHVALKDDRGEQKPVVPLAALLEASGNHAVLFVLDATGNSVRRVSVVVGRFEGDRVEVLSGVAAGERVVDDGAAYLHDGSAVRVLPKG